MNMINYLNIAFIIILSLTVCNKNDKLNQVPIEQINIDKSNNYRYIFRESIKRDRLREQKNKKNNFKD